MILAFSVVPFILLTFIVCTCVLIKRKKGESREAMRASITGGGHPVNRMRRNCRTGSVANE